MSKTNTDSAVKPIKQCNAHLYQAALDKGLCNKGSPTNSGDFKDLLLGGREIQNNFFSNCQSFLTFEIEPQVSQKIL